MDLSSATATGRLTALAQERARAEARETEAMLTFREAEHARTEALPPLRRQVERSVISLEIGQAMGLSEGQVLNRLATADRVREGAPQTWLAFRDGRIDLSRVREISSTIDTLERPESVVALDQSVLAYATTHTLAELRRWLRRFVLRVETDLALERAEAERKQRRVEVRHAEDSMSWLSAYLPSHVATAIQNRLAKEAKALGTADPRTRPQREADLLAAWLTTNTAGEAAAHADIAVTIGAEVLAGSVDGFAESADGGWAVPAAWVLDLARTSDPVFHRLVLDPVARDVLAADHVGRFAPELLAKALALRDGVCQAPGCLVPADRCDIDHREPWPHGPTSARNTWPLCRKHHAQKGHRVLTWILPSGQTAPAEPTTHDPPPRESSALEDRLARMVLDHRTRAVTSG